ncbi:MAG: Spy/CpxP family protein refolding chaperone [Thiobacillaceae bacterium]|jgi:Spy/CpxP family protein refolding chaperone|nr:Spy/CpxP family protein refolding chaperone [Thiobacillaceae bacterium]
MKNSRHFSRLGACGLAVALTAMVLPLHANQAYPAYPYGPAMMGGYGMGPGWGGYGMGQMMGGPGMGHMGGGPGMAGPNWAGALGLTEEQQASLTRIRDETRKLHWSLMSELMNQQSKLRNLYLAPMLDNDAISAVNNEINSLRQRMLDSAAEAHKNMRAVLTAEQVEMLQNFWSKREQAPGN